MQDWRATTRTDLFIRLAGGLLLMLAYSSGSTLTDMRAELIGRDPGVVHAVLAAVAFLAGTGGAACLLFGRCLFDRVTVARPWGGGGIAHLRPHADDRL